MRINITSRYGDVDRLHPKGHTGIDFAMPEGTPLRSVLDGVVERVVDYGGDNIGKGVLVRFSDGTTGIYGHMSEIKVRVGQHIAEGQTLGLSGNTGFSTGPHLHFGLKDGGSFVDPTPLAGKLGEFIERGSVANNDYPSAWGWLNEAIIGNGIDHWLANFSVALPIVLGVGIGVYGFLNMFSSKIAAWGVVGVFAFASIISISI
jgi:hypothetical protein